MRHSHTGGFVLGNDGGLVAPHAVESSIAVEAAVDYCGLIFCIVFVFKGSQTL